MSSPLLAIKVSRLKYFWLAAVFQEISNLEKIWIVEAYAERTKARRSPCVTEPESVCATPTPP